ncbi:MAG TPA: glycosyltransferase [Microvirga sp.]|jgi:GT2 family glycosyltransferase|nr:glycosyltransferase [Microvirga sp.]
MSLVTAIVVTSDSAEVLPDCLDALNAAGVPVVLVDNASTDGSAEIAAELGAKVIHNRRNEGYGRAANAGARAASSEFLLVLHSDVVVEPGAVAALLAAARLYPESGFFAPRVVEASGRVAFEPRSLLAPYLKNPAGILVLPEGDACVPHASGACFLVKRDLLLRLGGFDERIVLFFEDEDLCRRIADASPSLIYVPSASVRHAAPAVKPGKAFRRSWHRAWSHAHVSRKYHLPNPAPGIAARETLKAIGAALTFRRIRVERHGGAAAGAWAFLMRRTALAREGLAEPETRR